MEWQPIETAPASGEIIAWFPSFGWEKVWRGAPDIDWTDDNGRGFVELPTHWLPIHSPSNTVLSRPPTAPQERDKPSGSA